MTSHEIVSAIINNITQALGVVNSRIQYKQVEDEINTLRIRFIEEYSNKALPISTEYFQNIDCIRLECKPITECCDGINSKIKVLTSSIPSIVFNNSKPIVEYAGLIGRDYEFRIIPFSMINSALRSKYTSKVATIAIENNKLIVLNTPESDLEVLSIRAVFNNPKDLKAFACCNYDTKKSDFPAPSSIIDMIIGKTSESYIRLYYRSNPTPNTQSDIQPTK